MCIIIIAIQSGTFGPLFCFQKNYILEYVDYKLACGSIWAWNLVSGIKEGTQLERISEQGAEENIWTEEGWSDGWMEKTA
jgi:hypothetical protein